MSPYLARPVASLTVEVEDESGRTADGGEAVASFEVVLDATHGVPEAATVLLVTFDRNGGSNGDGSRTTRKIRCQLILLLTPSKSQFLSELEP